MPWANQVDQLSKQSLVLYEGKLGSLIQHCAVVQCAVPCSIDYWGSGQSQWLIYSWWEWRERVGREEVYTVMCILYIHYTLLCVDSTFTNISLFANYLIRLLQIKDYKPVYIQLKPQCLLHGLVDFFTFQFTFFLVLYSLTQISQQFRN